MAEQKSKGAILLPTLLGVAVGAFYVGARAGRTIMGVGIIVKAVIGFVMMFSLVSGITWLVGRRKKALSYSGSA